MQGTAPNFLIKFMALFDPVAKQSAPGLDKETLFDNTRMKEVLGITPRDIPTAIIDTAYSLIDNGMVKKTDKYKGRP